ncbi:MAG: succinate dehydrogenase assembly factor 2 [Pseudomonadota bacterium]
MSETREIRLKRLRIRCWRRGTKEMDLILGGFADCGKRGLSALDTPDLDAFERLIEENDQDLYIWISGQSPAPSQHAPMVAKLRFFHEIR